MLDLAHGWHMDVDRGPDWIFVRLHALEDDGGDTADLAEIIWSLMRQHFTNRIVLELDGICCMRSSLIGQIVLLQTRVHNDGGLLRICGLSENNQQVLRVSQLDSRIPSYPNRADAVMGRRLALNC